MAKGYCMKCKKKQEIEGAKATTMGKRKQPALEGKCSKCGTKVFAIQKRE